MKFLLSIFIFGLIGLLNAASIEESVRAGCAKVTTKPDFDVTKYLGVWYDITKLPFQKGVTCVRAIYSARSNDSVNVYNEGMFADGTLTTVEGVAVQRDPQNEPGNLGVSFGPGPAGSYLVLDTDYDQFAAVYSCAGISSFKLEYGWVLARNNSLSTEVLSKALAIFSQYGIDTNKFEMTPHENCKY